MTKVELQELAGEAITSAKLAGDIILSFYRKGIGSSLKEDRSPLTMADSASHDSIVDFLSKTKIPIVSEEGEQVKIDSTYYWMVDPLDGTKDFLAANNEFTVNIALLENNKPVIGVLYAPAIGELYVGIPGIGIWMEKDGRRKESNTVPESLNLKMATSRFHDHPDAGVFAEANNVKELVPLGSALKFGRLAFAEVDIYPRLVGTYEWDTAAGQAILEASGGSIIDWDTGKSLVYGKINRLNNRFIAFRSPYQYDKFIFSKSKAGHL